MARTKGCPISIDEIVPRKVPRELALVEPPQTRTEVVAIDAHADPQALIHVIEKLRESAYLPFQEKESVASVQIRRTVLAGERLELRDPLANRVCYGMREESEDMRVDTGWYILPLNKFIRHIFEWFCNQVPINRRRQIRRRKG